MLIEVVYKGGFNMIKDLIIPEELEHMELLGTQVDSTRKGATIVILGEHLRDDNKRPPTIRVFTANMNAEKNVYEIDIELDSYSFFKTENAIEFAEKLPHMSALELILYLN